MTSKSDPRGHPGLKLCVHVSVMGYYRFINFHQNRRGSGIFLGDFTWNDPYASLSCFATIRPICVIFRPAAAFFPSRTATLCGRSEKQPPWSEDALSLSVVRKCYYCRRPRPIAKCERTTGMISLWDAGATCSHCVQRVTLCLLETRSLGPHVTAGRRVGSDVNLEAALFRNVRTKRRFVLGDGCLVN